MKLSRLLAPVALTLGAAQWSCSGEEMESAKPAEDLADALQTVAGARILLGHQSVGRNILAGLDSLAADAGVDLRILEIDGVPPDSGPGLFHSNIGRNGDPDSKCEVFERLLDRPERPAYDVAIMKFCYADLGRGAAVEVASMLERYAKTVRGLRARRPDVHIVHATLPLMSDPPGLKTTLKRLIGRPTHRDADNRLRNAFNAGLRERFAGEALFDLAALESTRPDGTRSTFSRNGEIVHTLAPEYTDDGGHLNETGRRRVAAAFARTLAMAVRERTSLAPSAP